MGKIMNYAEVVEYYYNAACPSYAQNGYEKNVLINTHTEDCIFVSGEVTPEEDELLFRCKRVRGNTFVTLKNPRKEKKEKQNPKYRGIIRCVESAYGETSCVSLPPEIEHLPIQGVKLSNPDDFLELAMTPDDDIKGPYEVLHELDRQVVWAQEGFLEEGICVAYKRKPFCSGDYIFLFSHFEMIGTELCAVYDYNGSAC